MNLSKDKITTIILLLIAIGIILSIYLTYEHYLIKAGESGKQVCDISEGLSCSKVNASPWAEFLGIPVAILGGLWFVIAAVFVYFGMKPALEARVLKRFFLTDSAFALFVWSLFGMGFVFYLIYAELFLIHSICLFCTFVHIITAAILILSYKLLQKPVKEYLSNIFFKES